MIKTGELKIIKFLPAFLAENQDVIHLTNAIDEQLQKVYKKFDDLELLKKIENGTLTDEEISLLLFERHVDYFDEDLSRDRKIELIKNSITSHLKKGTPANLERVLKIIFGELTLLEWFNYGGLPYHFKVVIMDKQPSDEVVAKLNRTVAEYKNERSFFEGIMIVQTQEVLEYDFTGHTEIYYEEQLVN